MSPKPFRAVPKLSFQSLTQQSHIYIYIYTHTERDRYIYIHIYIYIYIYIYITHTFLNKYASGYRHKYMFTLQTAKWLFSAKPRLLVQPRLFNRRPQALYTPNGIRKHRPRKLDSLCVSQCLTYKPPSPLRNLNLGFCTN